MDSELTHDDIVAHVQGRMTVGVYQSSYPEELCKWIMYDIDHDENNPQKSEVQKTLLKSVLIHNNVPFYVEDSGSPNSVHVWVFLTQPTPLHLAYNWARAMTVRGEHYMFSGEIFPKQAALNPEKPYGNLVKVPYGIHQKSGRRTYFYDSSRGQPDPYMGRIETVDLTFWQPVDLPQNERGAKDRKTREPRESGSNVFVDGSPVGCYRYCQGVRPCVEHMVKTGMQLRHYDGHKLRIAIASDLLNSGQTEEEVVEAFRDQEDFDYWITLNQVRSVRGYNRPACDTIRWHVKNLQSESGFNIDEMCQECILSPDTDRRSVEDFCAQEHQSQDMNHAVLSRGN